MQELINVTGPKQPVAQDTAGKWKLVGPETARRVNIKRGCENPAADQSVIKRFVMKKPAAALQYRPRSNGHLVVYDQASGVEMTGWILLMTVYFTCALM